MDLHRLGRVRRVFNLVVTICLGSWLTITSVADTSVTVGTDRTKYVLRGILLTPDGLITGELVIENDTITCVAVTCTRPSGASVLSVSDAYIFPGFIDAHNHVAYNFLPKWTPPKLYQNRGQWQIARSYKNFKKPYDNAEERCSLRDC